MSISYPGAKPELTEQFHAMVAADAADATDAADRAAYRAARAAEATEAATAPAPPPAPAMPASTSLSMPELLGFIAAEVRRDAPLGWTHLIVDGEVQRLDPPRDGISTDLQIRYRARLADGTLQPFTLGNVYGPLNALDRLQRLMADEGDGWQRIRITIGAGDGVQLALDLPPDAPVDVSAGT